MLLFGDFNATRSVEERSSGGGSRSERRHFNHDYSLLEFEKFGSEILFSNNHVLPSFRKIDRFLLLLHGLIYSQV